MSALVGSPNIVNARILMLFLRQRGIAVTALSLVANVVLLVALRDWVAVTGQELRGVAAVLVLPSIVACIVGIAAWSPSADVEQTASYTLWLPRVVHLGGVLVTGLVSTFWAVGQWIAAFPPGVDLAAIWMRNAILLTGLALLAGCWFTPRLSWVVPVVTALLLTGYVFRSTGAEQSRNFDHPWWMVLAQGHESWSSWCISIVTLVAGLWAIARFGPRVTDPAEV